MCVSVNIFSLNLSFHIIIIIHFLTNKKQGVVAFSSQGDRIAITQIEQMIDGKYVILGHYDIQADNLSWTGVEKWHGNKVINWCKPTLFSNRQCRATGTKKPLAFVCYRFDKGVYNPNGDYRFSALSNVQNIFSILTFIPAKMYFPFVFTQVEFFILSILSYAASGYECCYIHHIFQFVCVCVCITIILSFSAFIRSQTHTNSTQKIKTGARELKERQHRKLIA